MKTADTLPDNGKTNEDYHDPIAKEVGRRLREGQHWRSNDRLGGKSVEQILTESYNQYHGILDPCDQELVDQSGIDVYVSPTAKKCSVLEAFMRDLIASDSQRLLQVRPTPIPDISDAGVEQVTEKLRASLSQLPPGSTPEQIRQIIRQLKDVQLQEEIILSEKEAKRQQRIISDQWTETRFLDQYMKFIHHLGRDPYAVMVGPIARGATVLQWSGNKMVPKYMENEYVKAYDPRDHFYSEDAQGKGYW